MPTYQQFLLPDAGEGLTEAEIVEWRVGPGDPVAVNQVIVEIETAKSLVELPSPWAGVVTRLLVPLGATAEVGAPIIEIDVDPGGTPAPAVALGHLVSGPDRSSAEPGGADELAAAGAEPRTAVLVGYGVGEQGAGRRPRRGATGPAVPAATTLVRSTAPAAPAALAPAASAALVVAPAAVAPTSTVPTESADTPARRPPHALAKPPVRKLARDLGIDLDAIAGTGPGGIVTREDLLAHGTKAEPRTLATYAADDRPWLASGAVTGDGRQTRVPVKSVRKRTAEAMVASAFTAPHVTVFHTVDV
ncbi:MAG: E3 binding domain-containing protein, partial [Actinobacteria bacterium]|nr:E3 binding domain-containing protein [Actinomycetota bacterium]